MQQRKQKSYRVIQNSGLLLLTLISGVAIAQAQATSGGVDTATLYIIFLHSQASDAQTRASENYRGPSLEEKASRLGVRIDEIETLDDAANSFVAQEAKLRQEAIAYSQNRKAAGQPDEPAAVRSFTTRREALAMAAFAALQSSLSPGGVTGLQHFIGTTLRSSIKSWR